MKTGRVRRLAVGGLLLAALAQPGCGGAASPSPAPAPTPSAPGSRPNIVIILVDDMATGLVGAERRIPFLNLPNLERMAASGVQFKNAFVTTSLCSPSRATILSGQYAHTHGVLQNETTELAASITTFPQLMQQAGYATAFVGKWHMDASTSGPRPGFSYWVSFRGQGVYNDPILNVNGAEARTPGYITDLLTDYAVNWLRKVGSQPFLLFLSHKAPHGPWEPAARDAGRLQGAALPEPPSYRDTFKDKPSWQRRYAICGGIPSAFVNCPDPLPAVLPASAWSGTEPWRLDYLRTLFAVDDSVGAVQSTLSALGLTGSTYIFFMSDNGFMLGEHRFGDKRVAYEDSLRIPFLVSGPGLSPREPAGLVLNLDVAPTVLELAGIPIPREIEGRSLARMLRGQAGGVRESFLYEYFADGFLPVVPAILGIRTVQQKLVTYPALGSEEELYDLASDPYELTNLDGRSEWITARESLREQLTRFLQTRNEGAQGLSAATSLLGAGSLRQTPPFKTVGSNTRERSGKRPGPGEA